jgi:hypothetical protein
MGKPKGILRLPSGVRVEKREVDSTRSGIKVESGKWMARFGIYLGRYFPQHFLYFLPLSHGHGSFRPIFGLGT